MEERLTEAEERALLARSGPISPAGPISLSQRRLKASGKARSTEDPGAPSGPVSPTVPGASAALLTTEARGFAHAPDGAAILDAGGVIVTTNLAWEDLAHAQLGTLVPESTLRVDLLEHYERLGVHDPSFSALGHGLRGVLDRSRPSYSRDIEVNDAGAPRWIQLRALPIDGGAQVVLTDVTERKQTEVNLIHEAMHDQLTGLANRALFADRLDHALRRAGRADGPDVAVLMIDLDHFKAVNDQYGHQEADSVLATIAKRLANGSRPGDTVARLGGDEFAVICEGVTDSRLGLRIAQRLLNICAQTIQLSSGELEVSMSIGMALATTETTAAQQLIGQADSALYRSKLLGRNRVELFDEALKADVTARITLERDLRLAFDRREFELRYQPMIDLRTGRVAGAEALIRWRHPTEGLIKPDRFIPIAEESGLIVMIGLWVLETACAQAMLWDSPQMTVSVNVSGRQMQDPDLVAHVVDVLNRTGLQPERLTLEITESVLIADGAKAAQRLSQLRRLGVKVALDDFGTGFSSLSYLHRFPVDIVKIDQSFVEMLGTEDHSSAIVSAIVSMTSALGVSSIAEGVETLEQLTAVRDLGSTLAQGFYFAEPLDADDLRRFTAA